MKFWVVWIGHTPGVYHSWEEASAQVKGFSGAKYKTFRSEAMANAALEEGWEAHYGKPSAVGNTTDASTGKFYAVWIGRTPGVYNSWTDASAQVVAFSGAKYKAFTSEALANAALEEGWEACYNKPAPAQDQEQYPETAHVPYEDIIDDYDYSGDPPF